MPGGFDEQSPGVLAAGFGDRPPPALNLPWATDVERFTRRVRSVSQRLEGIEDGVDGLDGRLAALNSSAGDEGRLSAIEEQLRAITRELAAIHRALVGTAPPVSRNQERLEVGKE